ncbi:MAG: ferritin-like domain-containing protein [Mycobacterium sp.]
MTSTEPMPSRPDAADAAALYDALTVEHATIYGYGIVSAHSTADDNDLVAEAMKVHRAQRERTIELLRSQSVTPPLPAAGYQLPMEVNDPTDAANLAVRMESDAAVAWRAVLEQARAGSDGDAVRAFAVSALTQSAVLTARWKRILKVWPLTQSFPGGKD